MCVVLSTKSRMNETLISSSDDISLSLRCLMAAVHSSLTSTRQRTPSTARRDWRSLQTDTSWSLILATTASKSTATCSSHSTQSLYSVHMYKHAVVRSNWKFLHSPLTCSPLNLAVIVPSVWPFSLPKLTQETILVVRGKRDDLWPTRMAAADWCSLETSFTFHLNVEYLKRL